jgi:hypothetical protein
MVGINCGQLTRTRLRSVHLFSEPRNACAGKRSQPRRGIRVTATAALVIAMIAADSGWSQTRLNSPHDKPALIEYRSVNGSGNNPDHPNYNVTNSEFGRIGPANFADGVSVPVNGPNARLVSNTVIGQGNADVVNLEGLSGMMFAWGQFIAHDFALGIPDGFSHIDISVPNHDAVFPDGTVIPVTRMIMDPASGSDPARPAIAINTVTGWLDASMVYGSDAMTAAKIRLPDGRLRFSTGDNLVIAGGKYVAGDIRAQETPPLTALHTLFMREHNYHVERLRHEHPDRSGDRLYQHARAIVAAEIAQITYAEFLPHLLGPDAIAPYRGYDPQVDPRIAVEFTGAAFRLGHSLVADTSAKLAENGTMLGAAKKLADAFFEAPERFTEHSGADGILRHLAAEPARALDARVVDSLRNRLNDPPASRDLPATNIQRARDLGIGTLNQLRVALGLPPYVDFHKITDDAGTLEALQRVYASVDDVDLWTGGLAERHAPGAMVGETFRAIIARQFAALRDGDRLWFENQGFDPQTLGAIKNTRLADIILRNTKTRYVQQDVFVFYQRVSGLNGGITPRYSDIPMLVIGGDGDDTLVGGPQNDYLVAGSGRQVMTGGEGGDTFVLSARGTDAVITDFRVGPDVLMFEEAGEFDPGDAHVAEDRGNAVITFGRSRITLIGIAPRDLNAYRFLAER